MNIWLDAAFWIGLTLVASMLSVWAGISVAMIEIVLGVIGGNFLGLQTTPWVDFLAGFGSIFLTFLAGAEVDPVVLRTKFKESVSIGVVSFLIPFAACFLFTYYVMGWSLEASQIAGIALSTTSVAIVYAVMVESGLNSTELGKIILAACFITDLGTVLALGILFAQYNIWLFVFIAVTVAALLLVNKMAGPFINALGGRVSQVEIKLIYFILFLLGGLALKANSEAVLPAYLLGLALAKLLAREKEMLFRMRTTAFATLTPFFFLKAGLLLDVNSLWAGLALILLLLVLKMIAKFIGVLPLTLAFKIPKRDSMYTTLLMSTGLTFGSISSMFGLTHNIIDQSQYSVLVTVVVLSGILPTLIAQAYFRPAVKAKRSDNNV